MERSCHVVLGGSRLRGRRCLRTALNPASFLRWLLMVGSPSRRAMWNSTENLSVGGRSPHIRAYRNLIGGFRSVSNGIDEIEPGEWLIETKSDLKEARTDISRGSSNIINAIKKIEANQWQLFKLRSLQKNTFWKRSESFKEELESLRLDKNKTSMEISQMRSELDAKLLEFKHLQMKLNGRDSHGTSKRRKTTSLSELEAALEESRKPTSSKVLPDKPEIFPGKKEMEQSLQRLETYLKETRRERDKARQELIRLKQHLLEKSFADLWVDFLLKDAEERERREEGEAAATKAKQDSEKTRQDAALSDSEFSTVPLRSFDSNQRLSRPLP
ncbi:hypothetical protein ARALYDRAFT_907714 [Arabidopsis lyrata subsp. lyrata]|uniref:Uncharacterized protein n=1 Tax=Arabidopsis lyrata subsp. lyrata TaxID=81972 RepID=D7LSD1_ARALL|nr:hypothetical protein ARALYDRAFT_907714 [Arabidopsis lyrata subsp. lyrata]